MSNSISHGVLDTVDLERALLKSVLTDKSSAQAYLPTADIEVFTSAQRHVIFEEAKTAWNKTGECLSRAAFEHIVKSCGNDDVAANCMCEWNLIDSATADGAQQVVELLIAARDGRALLDRGVAKIDALRAIPIDRHTNADRANIKQCEQIVAALEHGDIAGALAIEAQSTTTAPATPKTTRARKARQPKQSVSGSADDYSYTGIAEKFNASSDYAYNGGLGWVRWSGSRWQQIEETEVGHDLLGWATDQMMRAVGNRDRDAEKAYYGVRNGTANQVVSALQKRAHVPIDKFAEIPWHLNVQNGVIDLKTGTLSPHQRTYSLRQCNASFDPTADMSVWRQFVADIFPDPEMQHYVQVMLGYAITGAVYEEMFGIFHGYGKNGKSTLCNIISHVIGDYSGDIPTSELTIKRNPSDNCPHLARQVGKRILFANEPPEGMILGDDAIKKLGSRDNVSVCAKFKDPFEIKPTWLMIVRCNNRPQIRAVDDGVWRRVKEIPFTQIFTTPDKTIDQRMIDNHSQAILRWLVDGAMEYHKSGGLPVCQSVDDACETYHRESDSIMGWMTDCVVADRGIVEFQTLWESYTQWVNDNGGYPHSAKRLSDVLVKKGFAKVPNTRKSTFTGIRIQSK